MEKQIRETKQGEEKEIKRARKWEEIKKEMEAWRKERKGKEMSSEEEEGEERRVDRMERW